MPEGKKYTSFLGHQEKIQQICCIFRVVINPGGVGGVPGVVWSLASVWWHHPGPLDSDGDCLSQHPRKPLGHLFHSGVSPQFRHQKKRPGS